LNPRPRFLYLHLPQRKSSTMRSRSNVANGYSFRWQRRHWEPARPAPSRKRRIRHRDR
jgi:hypothetical protein